MNKAERTRQFIIETSAALFNAKGFSGTSLNDITEATGLTKGSLYGNFENKDEIALAVFDYNFGKIATHIQTRLEQEKTALDKLLVYPKVYRGFLDIPFLKGGCPLLNTAMEADDTHPLLKQRALQAYKRWKLALISHVELGIAQGLFKTTIHPENQALIIMSLIEGAVMQAKLTQSSQALHASMDFLEKLLLDMKA